MPTTSLLTTLKKNKGKTAGAGAIMAVVVAGIQCFSEVQTNKASIKENAINAVTTDMWCEENKNLRAEIMALRERMAIMESRFHTGTVLSH